ncbi:60S ribosomal protein L5 [Ancistrocladus abbreviatus]
MTGSFLLDRSMLQFTVITGDLRILWHLIPPWMGLRCTKAFLWLVGHDKLVVSKERLRWCLSGADTCAICKMKAESTLYALHDCPRIEAPEMAFVKAQKTKAYFKRFQVKFKRRREGKTYYRARTRLINQDKNKYNTPKYRFVVRFDIIAEIISASIIGDIVLAATYGHELPRYGLEVGLTNYAAAYCTGLLLAHWVLKMLEMDEEYEGNVEAIGEDFSVEPAESRRPFRALLDVGLVRTTTRNGVFGALKGALDGGLDIPHSDKRFSGFSKDGKQLDPKVHRKYIYGGHVAAYMRNLMEDEPEKYQTHFSEYIKRGIEADDMEELYKKVHAAIRAEPTAKKSKKEPPKENKRYNLKRLTYEERKARLIERLNALNSATGVDDDDEDVEHVENVVQHT